MIPKNQSKLESSKKPIKALFISHSSDVYGAEKSLLLLLKNIDRKRFNPIVVIPASGPLEEELKQLSIKVYKIESPEWVCERVSIALLRHCITQELLSLIKIINVIKKEKIEIIYTNTITIFSGAISAYILKIPHVWHIRELIENNPNLNFLFSNKTLFNFILKFSNRIIAISQAVAGQFTISCPGKIIVISNAVDFQEFKEKTPFPNINGIKPTDYLTVVVGTLEKRKAQDDAIRAIKIASLKIPNIKLLLIGRDSNNFKKQLEQLSVELCLSDKVIFMGHRNDVPHVLQNCRALLMPSWEEPFGRATIEAMAAGIPVIGTNSGGTKEILQDGITGYLVSPKNPSEIAERIIKLYEHPEIEKKFGDIGKKAVKEKYNPEKYAQDIEKIIENIFEMNKCQK